MLQFQLAHVQCRHAQDLVGKLVVHGILVLVLGVAKKGILHENALIPI